MINIIKIEEISNFYPEAIIGTNEWFACCDGKDTFCDLYEAEEIFNEYGSYSGMTCHLVHYPDGKVYSPFLLSNNVYVEKPIWNNGELDFLVIDFKDKKIQIIKYVPETKVLEKLIELPLSKVKDCYNLKLEVQPLTLGRSGMDGLYEIIWPEETVISIGDTETVLFRDEDKLYLSEWYENPEYHENVIIRDIQTGKIIEKYEGYLCRMPGNVFWRI